ncbi:MAG: hypothetical protein K8R52_12300, partial [Bacteroidales bacterium]|nr:hypothetical protein [Bacteroidales bacterium]
MQTTSSFITGFTRLGQFLRQFSEETGPHTDGGAPYLAELNRLYFNGFSEILENEPIQNPWFTPDSLIKALKGIASMLEEEVLQQWLNPYGVKPVVSGEQKTVGLVMAGNIPMVGFHDLLSVLATGHKVLAKPSSKDD